ncbi:MAG: hypothetical protein KGL39_33085 [Patescibacteria group bacterium]|nr:hypothetical protein [Patescibacteria group bacterium]
MSDSRSAPVKARAFLAAYRMTGQVRAAAKLARISRGLHYKWLKYGNYKAAFEHSRLRAGQNFEDELIRRAIHGHLEPVFYQGELVAKVRRYPDHLLLEACKAFLPHVWKKRIEHTGADGGPIKLADYRLDDLSDDELANLVTILKKATGEKKES